MDTIAALATAPGKAGIAVIRVSGPRAFEAVGSLTSSMPKMRQAQLRVLKSPDGTLLDQALVLLFPAGQSFTGEDVAELQLHGSPATTRAVLSALFDLPGVRQADQGEFTRRALENGCLDLSQVEGLADLLDAETEAQRKQALRVFSGAIGDIAEGWRKKLIRAAALIEATIDFADEEVPTDVGPEVGDLLLSVKTEISAQIAGLSAAERIRDGFEVAIVGAPNVGKSTLLNALAKREAAIISDIPGTTRDVIEIKMDLDGLPVTFLDTAGLRETEDSVEAIGVARARDRARSADLRVFLLMPGDQPDADLWESHDLSVPAKADLRSDGDGISGVTGSGLVDLIEKISNILQNRASSAGIATRERHRIALITALERMGFAEDRLNQGPEFSEIASEEIRTAIRALDSLVGRVDIEHILDEIFASFCLGK